MRNDEITIINVQYENRKTVDGGSGENQLKKTGFSFTLNTHNDIIFVIVM